MPDGPQGRDFVCCDNPTAARFTIHILAAVAEHERDAISVRTNGPLAAAKARGHGLDLEPALKIGPVFG